MMSILREIEVVHQILLRFGGSVTSAAKDKKRSDVIHHHFREVQILDLWRIENVRHRLGKGENVQNMDTITVITVRLLGVIGALAAILTTRTAQGAAAWAIALIAYPYVALPLYLIFGWDRFKGYVRARRIQDEQLRKRLDRVSRQINEQPSIADAKRYGLEVFEGLAGMKFTQGNAPTLLINGEETFDAIMCAIDKASRYVLIEFYIVRDDDLGRRLLNAMARAVQRGVQVCFLYDAIGSHTLTKAYKRDLDAAGIKHGAFLSTRDVRSRIQANFRNHRKIVVVDGRVCFIGGHNVGIDYLGLYPKIGPWRDTHVRIEGPVACEAQLAFLEDWYWTMNAVPEFLLWDVSHQYGSAAALILPMGPADGMSTCAAMFTEAFNTARERIWLATPYFVPDPAMMTSMRLARLRGVDVRILLTGKSDNAISDLATSTYVSEALQAGARVFRYMSGFMHQKVFLVDSALSSIMSANFDVRSFRLNFEIAALVKDAAFAQHVAEMLEKDLAQSEEVHLNKYENVPIGKQLLARTARLLTPVL